MEVALGNSWVRHMLAPEL